jgi:uncharacterized protein (DUF2267 family)
VRYDEMVSAIRDEVQLPDREHADKALRADVAVLGERLSGQEPFHLRPHLPPELQQELPTNGGGQSFDADEFVRRVGEREALGCSQDEGREHTRAVLSLVLGPRVAGTERGDVAAQLPRDLRSLMGTR